LTAPAAGAGAAGGARVARVEAWPVNVPLDAPYLFAPGTYRGMSRTVLRVTASDGVHGLGETPSPHDAALLRGELGERIVGRSAAELRGELGADAVGLRTAARGARVDPARALAGVEMALWDIAARVAGVPLHVLLGGAVRSAVAVTEYFAFRVAGPAARGERTPVEVAARCAAMIEAHGSTAFEGKVAVRPLDEELRMVAEVRRAIGPDRELRLDANLGWRTETAERAIAALAPLRIANLEEPVGSLQQMAELRRTSPIPFSSHEVDVERVAALGAADAFVLNVAACGGIAGARRTLAACERAGAGFWLYGGDLGVATACGLHLAAATPAIAAPSQTLLRWYSDDVIAQGPFVPERGLVPVPSGPGLGVELDERALARGVERFAREGEYDLYERIAEVPRY
jgi:glucarate dehydratase